MARNVGLGGAWEPKFELSVQGGMSNATREADTRLATYGTLGPGRPNHHKLAELEGQWRTGTVRGRLVAHGWGAELGYPALVLDRLGPPVEVSLLESADLPKHWSRLDDFEGDGYQRVIARVDTEDGPVDAWIYVTAVDGEPN